jgi:hypothetical protein
MGKRSNAYERKYLVGLFVTMEEMKDSPTRDRFMVNFDENYDKLEKEIMNNKKLKDLWEKMKKDD